MVSQQSCSNKLTCKRKAQANVRFRAAAVNKGLVKHRGHILAHLEAALPYRRAHGHTNPIRLGAKHLHSPDSLYGNPGYDAAPSCMHRRYHSGLPVGHQQRHTVGSIDTQSYTRIRGNERIHTFKIYHVAVSGSHHGHLA